jgi:hypothetical protein
MRNAKVVTDYPASGKKHPVTRILPYGEPPKYFLDYLVKDDQGESWKNYCSGSYDYCLEKKKELWDNYFKEAIK